MNDLVDAPRFRYGALHIAGACTARGRPGVTAVSRTTQVRFRGVSENAAGEFVERRFANSSPGGGILIENNLKGYVRLSMSHLREDLLRHPEFMIDAEQRRGGRWRKMIIGPRKFSEKEQLDFVKATARRIAQQYGIRLPRLGVRFTELVGETGRITKRKGTWYIDLSDGFVMNDIHLGSTLAHEIAHIVLLESGILLQEEAENEKLTDTTAVMAGFGRLLLAGKTARKMDKWFGFVDREVILTSGYLDSAAIKSLTRLREHIRSGQPVDERRDGANGIVDCLGCGTRIRVPPMRGDVQLTCPVCELKQLVRALA